MKSCGYKRLLKSLLRYRSWVFLISVIGNIFIFSDGIAVAYFVRRILNIVEHGISNGENVFMKIRPYLIGILIVAVIRILAIKVCAFMDRIQVFYYVNILRNNILELVYKKKNIKTIAGNSEKVFEIMSRDTEYAMYPAHLLAEVLGYTAFTIMAVSSLLIVNWRVTVFVFIPVSIAIFTIRLASKKIKVNRKANREIHERVSETISDTSNLVQTIKVTGAKKNVLRNLEKLNNKRLSVVLKDTLFESSLQAVTGSTVLIGTAVMMLVVAENMIKGEFPIGDFSMFVWYLGSLANCIERIMELVAETKQGEVSYDRIINLVGEENQKKLTEYVDLKALKKGQRFKGTSIKKIPLEELEVKNLTYAHDNKNGIQNVSFKLKPGKIVAIAGGIGSGKSTVLNALIGVVPKDSGEILWNGKQVVKNDEFFKPPNAAYSPQITKMFSGSLMENLLMGKEVSDLKIEESFYDGVFEMDFAQMERGLETEAGSGGNRLSGGQKQRFSLARMFIHDAQIYIMDDTTSAIDIETEKAFWKRFDKNLDNKKFTCLIASNKKQVLERADEIIFMKNGQVIDIGKADELCKRCVEFVEIYR